MRAKTVFEAKLAELIRETPNDSELGKLVRSFHSNYNFGDEEAERAKMLMETMTVIKSGYAGVLSNGNIVDRRKYHNAIPIQENEIFDTPKPKDI